MAGTVKKTVGTAKMPTKLRIGAQWYRVEQRKSGEDGMLNDDSHGYTLEQRNLIVISEEVDESHKRQLILHEIMHALNNAIGSATRPGKGADFGEWEHHFISLYEPGLTMVLQDNPQLVAYIVDGAK